MRGMMAMGMSLCAMGLDVRGSTREVARWDITF
jgi:hypothetical protein